MSDSFDPDPHVHDFWRAADISSEDGADVFCHLAESLMEHWNEDKEHALDLAEEFIKNAVDEWGDDFKMEDTLPTDLYQKGEEAIMQARYEMTSYGL